MLHAQQSKHACLDLIDEVLKAESSYFNDLCKLSAVGVECHACTAAAGSSKACNQSRGLFISHLQSGESAGPASGHLHGSNAKDAQGGARPSIAGQGTCMIESCGPGLVQHLQEMHGGCTALSTCNQ